MEATPHCPYVKARSYDVPCVVHQPAGHSCPVPSQGRSRSLRHIALKARPAHRLGPSRCWYLTHFKTQTLNKTFVHWTSRQLSRKALGLVFSCTTPPTTTTSKILCTSSLGLNGQWEQSSRNCPLMPCLTPLLQSGVSRGEQRRRVLIIHGLLQASFALQLDALLGPLCFLMLLHSPTEASGRTSEHLPHHHHRLLDMMQTLGTNCPMLSIGYDSP